MTATWVRATCWPRPSSVVPGQTCLSADIVICQKLQTLSMFKCEHLLIQPYFSQVSILKVFLDVLDNQYIQNHSAYHHFGVACIYFITLASIPLHLMNFSLATSKQPAITGEASANYCINLS